MLLLACVVLAPSALTGCAAMISPVEVRLTQDEAPAPLPGLYILDTQGLDDAGRLTLEQALADRGWRMAAGEDEASWLLSASYTVRPQTMGVHIGDTPPADSADWLAAPVDHPWWRREGALHVFTLAAADRQGRVHGVQARQIRPMPEEGVSALPTLIDQALSAAD